MRQLISLSFAAAFVFGLAPIQARAQPLADPMRPPAAAMPGAGAQASAVPPASGLQGVISSPGRKLALIDGSVVPLGAAVRDATLTGVADSFAVLKKNGDGDVLLMHPNIDKKPRASARGSP